MGGDCAGPSGPGDGSVPVHQRLFGNFFHDVKGCLQLMERTSAVSLGSAVLRALLGDCQWEANDLGIFVQDESMDGDELFEWTEFLSREGYVVDAEGGRGAFEVTAGCRLNRRVDGKKVFLVCGVLQPVQYIIRASWATHVMNFATHEALYSLFPEATLIRKEMYMLTVDTISELESFQKYLDRRFHRGDGDEMRVTPEFQGLRFVGDRFTKRVGFFPFEEPRSVDFGGVRFEVGRRTVRVF